MESKSTTKCDGIFVKECGGALPRKASHNLGILYHVKIMGSENLLSADGYPTPSYNLFSHTLLFEQDQS